MSFRFVNAVNQILTGAEPCLYMVDLDEVSGNGQITFRDLIRTAFSDQGVEIEFSGKGINERGVVIDIDEDKLRALGVDPNRLRFGQTVVRVRQ